MLETSPSKQLSLATWFDNFVATLRAHELQMETKTATPELQNFYNKLIGGNTDHIAQLAKSRAQRHFLSSMVLEYLTTIRETMPLKLAFDFHDSEISVWSEIKDGDLGTERNLLKAEAIINAKYHQYGFDIETTIVEVRDCLKMPDHFKVFKEN